ncbi:MAG: hypothetical protein IPM82_04360 [Saprospiraceae bacterium]|nr:hypothetical protein [Saprospiraceae bacterium]
MSAKLKVLVGQVKNLGTQNRPNQISGTVGIEINKPKFSDKSGREGIQKQEVLDLIQINFKRNNIPLKRIEIL